MTTSSGDDFVGAAVPPARDVASVAHRMVDMAPTGFTRDVMSGAAMVLDNRDNPIRLNLFAVSIRIFLDHLMDALAPRAQVEACRWFKLEKDTDAPTRRQRLAYGLHGGFTPEQVNALAGLDAEELVQEVADAYRELNKHVHGREKTIVRDVDEQDVVAREILEALAGLLEAEREYRATILDPVAEALESRAVERFVTETVENLDIMASHYNIEWVGVDERRVVAIDATRIEYEVVGSIGVTLLYGSSGDRRRGEGAEMSDEFPYKVRFKVPIEDPHDLTQAEITDEVDTTAWYGIDDEEEAADDEGVAADDFDLSVSGKA